MAVTGALFVVKGGDAYTQSDFTTFDAIKMEDI